MSLRTVTIDFTAESPISKKEIGLIGEHNATTLNIIPPIDMSTNANIDDARGFITVGKDFYHIWNKENKPILIQLSKKINYPCTI